MRKDLTVRPCIQQSFITNMDIHGEFPVIRNPYGCLRPYYIARMLVSLGR